MLDIRRAGANVAPMKIATLVCISLLAASPTPAQFGLLTRQIVLRTMPGMAKADLKCEQVDGPEIRKLERSHPQTQRERWTFKGCERQVSYQLIVVSNHGEESIGKVLRETVPEESILIVHEVIQGANDAQLMLVTSGYRADWSMASLAEVDRLIEEHSAHGQPKPGGVLEQGLSGRLFGLGGYVGETLRRNLGGTWNGDDDDSEAASKVALVLPDGSTIWPVQRVMKRFGEGSENSVADYGRLLESKMKKTAK
jgi:hypothetical protein